MTYTDIIHLVSQELNLPEEIVTTTYKAYWQAIRDMISNLPLKENISTEEFLKLKTSFNIPSLGKLYCTEEHFTGIKKKRALIKKILKDGYSKN